MIVVSRNSALKFTKNTTSGATLALSFTCSYSTTHKNTWQLGAAAIKSLMSLVIVLYFLFYVFVMFNCLTETMSIGLIFFNINFISFFNHFPWNSGISWSISARMNLIDVLIDQFRLFFLELLALFWFILNWLIIINFVNFSILGWIHRIVQHRVRNEGWTQTINYQVNLILIFKRNFTLTTDWVHRKHIFTIFVFFVSILNLGFKLILQFVNVLKIRLGTSLVNFRANLGISAAESMLTNWILSVDRVSNSIVFILPISMFCSW